MILTIIFTSCKKDSSNSSTTTNPIPMVVGKAYQGGIIAYVDLTGQHGIIAATEDLDPAMAWDKSGQTSLGTSSVIGTGKSNTDKMYATGTSVAATNTRNFTLNGYTDWYIPSRDELNQVFINKTIIGGFDYTVQYWSSSESGSTGAYSQHFGTGTYYTHAKTYGCYIRPVRSF